MIEYYKNMSVTPVTIHRIEARLVLPGEPLLTPQKMTEVLVEDARAWVDIVKAEDALEERIENGEF